MAFLSPRATRSRSCARATRMASASPPRVGAFTPGGATRGPNRFRAMRTIASLPENIDAGASVRRKRDVLYTGPQNARMHLLRQFCRRPRWLRRGEGGSRRERSMENTRRGLLLRKRRFVLRSRSGARRGSKPRSHGEAPWQGGASVSRGARRAPACGRRSIGEERARAAGADSRRPPRPRCSYERPDRRRPAP